MLRQRLQQKLLQKLSPQQIQLMKLIQLPMIELELRVKEEIENNPALEEGKEEEEMEENVLEDDFETEEFDDEVNEDKIEALDDFDMSDFYADDDIPAYKLKVNNKGRDDEEKEMPMSASRSFHDLLISQLGLQPLAENQQEIGRYLIGNIDDAGYLRRELSSIVDDLAFIQNITTTEEELEKLLFIIQEFDPAGIGARNLQECLLLQLSRKDQSNQTIQNAKIILEKYFDAFSKKHYSKIIADMEISEENLKEAIDEIVKLNPKPGSSSSDSEKFNQAIIPDFTVTNLDGKLEVILNSRNAPELKVNKAYAEMITAYQKNKQKTNKSQKDALIFAKQKLDTAKWFIDAVKQREETLYTTMLAIVEYQKEFFLEGDDVLLKPMILKDIATMVGLDISTISRVANSKYVQTPFGTYSLKYFFSESLATESGEEVSTREVKKILQDCIDNENKREPVTDEELGKILREKGYKIARRTVAKYREQLNIPVARLRKEL